VNTEHPAWKIEAVKF